MRIRDCIVATAKAFDLSPAEIMMRTREHHISRPRHAAMLLARWEGFTTTHIARVMRMREHTSVVYGARAAARRADADDDFGDRLQKAWLYAHGWSPWWERVPNG